MNRKISQIFRVKGLSAHSVFSLARVTVNNIYFPFRSSNVPAKRKIKPRKANAPGRFEDERSCSESESSDDDYEDSEYSDDDNHDSLSDWHRDDDGGY